MDKFLFRHIDNTGLSLWRIAFGLLIAVEAFGAISTGWVRRTLVEPDFTFNFIGFEFLQPLPGDGMYYYFALMGVFGLMVMFGYKYRLGMIGYALMWSAVYLMQKTSYNNHYYLLMILCWLMVFLPAHRSLSLDALWKPKLRSLSSPRWVYLVVIFLIWIVFSYASIAKIYPDWLNGTAPRIFMRGKSDYWLIGDFLQQRWVHIAIAYFGIIFDLIIIPLFLWKRTRVFGLVLAVFFHIFNSIVFQIGIFPYMSLAFAFFFFSSITLKRRFNLKRNIYIDNEVVIPNTKPVIIGVFTVFFTAMILLPLRHWIIKDEVLWTEEGHRLSWRMMLRSKKGQLVFWTVDKESGNRTIFPHAELLSKKQRNSVRTKPDMIWQLAQRIHQTKLSQGEDVGITVTCRVAVNGGEFFEFIDPKADLAAEPWDHFRHHEWLRPSPEDYHSKPEVKEEEKVSPVEWKPE